MIIEKDGPVDWVTFNRPDNLNAAVVNAVAERLAHLLHRRLLRMVASGLLGNAYQHIGGPAELLKLHIAEAEAAKRSAHLGKIGRAGFLLHLKQRSAAEIDAEIESVREEQDDRDD